MNENKHVITGKIIEIDEDITSYDSGFVKKGFMIKTDEKTDKGDFSQKLIFYLVKDRTRELDGFAVGDVINVHYNLRGSQDKATGKWYNNPTAWKIEKCQ